MLWIPFFAAGVINGVGHYFGYRNFEIKDNARNIIPFGFLISTIIFFELVIVIGGWKFKPDLPKSFNLNIDKGISNTHSIGEVLYTDYILLFQISGMILLVSMIGAIVLTYRKRDGLKRQSYFKQI